MRALFLVTLSLLATPAMAETYRAGSSGCNQLPNHQPSADVNVQVGADAKGKQVTPADITAAPVDGTALGHAIVPIEVPLRGATQDPNGGLGLRGNYALPGIAEVAPDGTTAFNGQIIGGPGQSTLSAGCQ